MAILKTNNISTDPAINAKLKTNVSKDEILQRFNPTKTDNILPCDGGLSYLSEKVDQCIDSINPNVLKVGITDAQADRIITNSSKVGITPAQASAITANTAKTGISSGQASAITDNTAKTGISSGQASAIVANTAKTVLTIGTGSGNAKAGNTTTISSGQASAIIDNTAKNTNVVQTSVTGNAGTATKIATITNDNIVQLAGNQTLTGTKTFSATIVGSVNGNSATTSETTITSGQASAITANTAKTGISSGQASEITANTKKVSMVIGTKETQAKAGNTTTISDAQVLLLKNLGKGITVTSISLSFSKDRNNNLTITDGTSNWVIAAAR